MVLDEDMTGIIHEGDSGRELTMRPDIYEFAFTLCLKQEELILLTKDDDDNYHPQCLPLMSQLNEIFIASYLCAISVCFCAAFVCYESLTKKTYCGDEEEIDSNLCFKYISWELQVTRLICACLFHFYFEGEISNALSCCKYVLMNPSKFRYSGIAFSLGLIQIWSILFIEVVQVVNLVQYYNLTDIISNFVALLVLAQFDDFFLELFMRHRIKIFLEKTLAPSHYRNQKLVMGFEEDPEEEVKEEQKEEKDKNVEELEAN